MFTGAVPLVVEHTVSSPVLIAGLAAVHPVGIPTPVQRATVWVGPLLLASPAGSSWGLVLQVEVPIVFVHPEPAKPQVSLSSRLWPPSVIVAMPWVAQLVVGGGGLGAGTPATMTLVAVSEPPSVKMFEPAIWLKLLKVQLVSVVVLPTPVSAPPCSVIATCAVLPTNVLLVTVSVADSL